MESIKTRVESELKLNCGIKANLNIVGINDSNDNDDQKIHTNHETDNANQSNTTNFDLKVTLSNFEIKLSLINSL